MISCRNIQSHDRGSMAMVLVLITIALITAIVIELMSTSRVASKIVANRRDAEKAYALAEAATRWSIFRLQLDASLDKLPAIPNTNYGGKKDDLMEFQWAFPIPYPFDTSTIASAIQGTGEAEVKEKTKVELDGSFLSSITDESSKINLNDVGSGGLGTQKKWSGAAEILENLLLGLRFQKFFDPYEPGKDHRELLWAIEDWVDQDSDVNHLGGGIEDSEYSIDGMDLNVKNAPFFTLAEIRMIKPMTEDLYRELLPFITVHPFDAKLPRISTQQVIPQGRININTVPLELMAALFSRQALPDDRDRLTCAQKVILQREGVVFRNKSELTAFVQNSCNVGVSAQGGSTVFTPAVFRILEVYSNTFTIEGTGSVGSIEKTIRAVVSRQDSSKPRILFWKVI